VKWYFVCSCGHEFTRTTPCRQDLTRWECPTRKGIMPRTAQTLPEKLEALRRHRVGPAMFPWEARAYREAKHS
jgi:hypothetical protein